ncbi:MAG TPA: UDP-N-acetylmuramoyl-L-alanine--D-glutamate ligase, partial [Usitatibacter sp.]|nr:UDP-N-acetylmuramoyl-L-alanine--D-glutamate ligase [Usitatibacter sp.]
MKNDWQGRKVLVLGLGDTGLACIRWLSSRGAVVRAADSRAAPPGLGEVRSGYPQVDARPGSLDKTLLEGMDTVVASPGLALREPVLQA